MSDDEQTEYCYCKERLSNPKLKESMKDLPEGFCGICDVCGKPGHTKAHPSLPTSGAWCDEHWNDLITKKAFNLQDIFGILFLTITVITIIGLIIYFIL